jgi:hypothetical protein
MKNILKSYYKKKWLIVFVLVSIAAVFSLVNPAQAKAAYFQKVDPEADGTESWEIRPDLGPSQVVTILPGGYGNGITAPLISLHVMGPNTVVKILGPHTFYNLTVDNGATITTEALVRGDDYTVVANNHIFSATTYTYPLNPSAQEKVIDLSVKNKLILNGTITADGLGYRGGYLPFDGSDLLMPTDENVFQLSSCYVAGVLYDVCYLNLLRGTQRGHGPGGGQERITYENLKDAGAGGSFGGLGAPGFACDDARCTTTQTVVPVWMPSPGPTYGVVGDFGSGGGYANHRSLFYPANGGAGGGVIKIKAKKIEMGSNSSITANGVSGEGDDQHETAGGAGSGGSIDLLFHEGSVRQPLAGAGVNNNPNEDFQAWRAHPGVVDIDSSRAGQVSGSVGIAAEGGDGIYYAGAGGGGRIHIGPLPTLTSTLTADPSTGVSPLSSRLTATAGGTATGTLNYSFWWNCENSSTSVSETIAACGNPTNDIGAKFDGVDVLTEDPLHTYASADTYHPKVIIERGVSLPTSSQATVTVSDQNLPETLAGTLTATPPGGDTPLTTNLTAAIDPTSTATNTISYTFWWDCDKTGSVADLSRSVDSGGCGDPGSGSPTLYGEKHDKLADTTANNTITISHIYDSNGPNKTYHPKVIIEQGTAPAATASADVAVTRPSLTGTLRANPAGGLAPLSSQLVATATGSIGSVNYTFWYNCDKTGNSVEGMSLDSNCHSPGASGSPTQYGEKHDGQSDSYTSPAHVFEAGIYNIKLIIERGEAAPLDLHFTMTVDDDTPVVYALDITSLTANPSSGLQPLNPSLAIDYNANVAGPWDVYVYCKTANTTPDFTYLNQPDASTAADSSGRASPWFSGSISIPPPSPDTHCAYTGSNSGAITLRVVMKNSARPTVLDSATVGLNAIVPTYGLTIAATGTGSAAAISVKEFTSNQPAGVTMRYTMYCDRNDTSTTVTNDYDAQISSTQRANVPIGVCNYTAFGTYYPKVIVEYPLGSPAVLTPVAQDTDIYDYSGGSGGKTLFASLSASPNPGAVNRSIILTGSKSEGTAAGNLNYKFYCKNTDTEPALDTTIAARSTQATCTYGSNGSYIAKLVLTQENIFAIAQTTIMIVDPTLLVSLTPIPNNPAINVPVTLKAVVSGTTQGDIIYEFYCLKDDANYAKRIVSASTSVQADNLCKYDTAGSLQAMVKVSRESQAAQALATITVSSSGTNGQIIFEEDGGPIKIRGSLVANQVIFNARNKGSQKYSVRIYSDKNVLASRLPGFSDIMTIINQKQ